MGILAERSVGADRYLLNQRRAKHIEGDVCRRLGVGANDRKLARLAIDFSSVGGRARLSIEMVEIAFPGKDPLVRYGIKAAHHISEAWISQLASQQGIGPLVLDVEKIDGGCKGKEVILEEYLPHECNLGNRTPGAGEYRYFARHMSSFFLSFMCLEEGRLIKHGDERPEHIFILGKGKNIQVKMIDWGRGSTYPLGEIEQWGEQQFDWFYNYLSRSEPKIWRSFSAFLLRDLVKMKVNPKSVSQAYMNFVGSRTRPFTEHFMSMQIMFAKKFLDFCAECGKLDLNSVEFNRFLKTNRSLRGDDLAQAYLKSK